MKNPARMIDIAATHHQAGRFPDAEKTYREILKIDKRNADALRLLGGLYLQINRPALAEQYLEQAAAARPNDAEILNNLGVALRNQGKLKLAIALYEQAIGLRPHYPQALNNLASAWSECGKPEQAIPLFMQSLQLRPDNPQVHLNLGNALRALGKPDEAAAHYEEALRLQPNYHDARANLVLALIDLGRLIEAEAQCARILHNDPDNVRVMNNYGTVLRELRRPIDAVRIYQRALQIQPDYAEAYINLGTVYRDMDKPDEAQRQYEQALRLKPDSAEAMINMATLMLDFGRWDAAAACYDDALRVKPDSAEAKWSKSLALLALGEYREGWEKFEAGLNNPRARGTTSLRGGFWNGAPFPGKKLMIWSEQGFGDSLQFIRYAAMCKPLGGEIMVVCPRPLARLFKNCPFIDRVTSSVNEGEFDHHIPMMSLPHVFGTLLETVPAEVPYLFVDDATRQKWAAHFAKAKGFKVGLVWAGGSREHQRNAHLIDRRRSINLSLLKPLLDIEQTQFYSLQMDAPAAQIGELGLGGRIIDLMPQVTDFLDTAAIIENLDLVIAVDTSVVHLAGGLGKPVWVLSRFDACWRWLRNQERNPWYPTARIFGQSAPGAWRPVIDRVRQALETELTTGNI